MDLKNFKHCTPIQIRYKDVDKQGHVNNANHLSYFKDVFKIQIDWDKTGLILAHSEITYNEPIFLEDSISCYTSITTIGTKSFEISNVLTKRFGKTETVCAFGKSVLVCFDYIKKETIEVPEQWRNYITEFEKA